MDKFQNKYNDYKRLIDDKISSFIQKNEPVTLYKPLKYILNGGGKRIRPVLLLFSCEAAGGNPLDAVNAAIAVEILHNFTLIHDDIMDNADSRRGKETIHKVWDSNVAILAGDNLVGLAYESLLKTQSADISKVVKEFTTGIIEVCEGQSFDKEFEIRKDVTLTDYMMMIDKKTSKLLETSAAIGALIANANPDEYDALKLFARNLGLAFQIQDDLLDILGDEKKFGKKIGGDIIEGKKTYLLLKAIELVDKEPDKSRVLKIVSDSGIRPGFEKEIENIKKIYSDYGVIKEAREEIEHYTKEAENYLSVFRNNEAKEMLKWFSRMLLGRSH
jgi:geranylgeranyl diphosphate synthase type II